jgi:hypothetical protein
MKTDPKVLAAAGLNPDQIVAEVEAVLADPLYWFPVRHHSPSTARHLATVIKTRKPKVIFIEGPFEATDLIQHVVHAETVPPVAIYSSYRDDDNVLGWNGIASPAPDIPARYSSWYPLTAYSPEYVTMKTAANIGAECQFIDLPHHAGLEPNKDEKPQAKRPVASNEDRLITTSGFYQRLAAAGGFKTWDEAWDTLFENPHTDDPEAFRRDLALFCRAVRGTADPEADRAEGTIQRERHFLKVIQDTLARKKLKPEQAMVVCGGYHLFLDRKDRQPPPTAPKGTVYVSVVPYSFFRVSELAGYGAGNRAPQFYHTTFDLVASGRADDIPLEHAVAVLRNVRKAGDPLSTADAISVTHHAQMLARLRGRTHPVLDDIHDALMTCCCKGNPAEEGTKLLAAMDAAGIGNRIGKVTSKLGRLPIVNDFHNQLHDLELGDAMRKDQRMNLKLDKRQPLDARRSAFLHRLVYQEVPFAVLSGTGGDFSGTLFREDWQAKWDPKTEPALIEQNLYGDTVEAAALARLREAVATTAGHAGATCEQLVRAVNMDLPDVVRAAEDACGKAIDTDPNFLSLAAALQHLGLLERYAVFRGLRQDLLANLFERCYDRACFALPDAAAVPEDDQPKVVQGLIGVAEIVQRAEANKLDRSLFAEAAKRAAAESPVPFLRGAFLGLLCEIRQLPAEALAAEVAGLARAAPDQMMTAGDLLDGMLAVSRTSILLGAEALVTAVDELLAAADWDSFLVMLPRLRGAFERLPESQRDSLATVVARQHGLTQAAEVTALSGSLGATALVAKLDSDVKRILSQWPM